MNYSVLLFCHVINSHVRKVMAGLTLQSAGEALCPPPALCSVKRAYLCFFKAISISKSFSAGVLKVAGSAFQIENQKTKFTKVFNISEKKYLFEKNRGKLS